MFADLEQRAASATPTDRLDDFGAGIEAAHLFMAIVDFLSDPERLPDPDLNTKGKQLHEALSQGLTRLVFESRTSYDAGQFQAVEGHDGVVGLIALFRDFADHVRTDLLTQICGVANMASLSRDFIDGHHITKGLPWLGRHGRMHSAQVLNTLLPILESEGRTVQLTIQQRRLRLNYPQGIHTPPPLQPPGLSGR